MVLPVTAGTAIFQNPGRGGRGIQGPGPAAPQIRVTCVCLSFRGLMVSFAGGVPGNAGITPPPPPCLPPTVNTQADGQHLRSG